MKKLILPLSIENLIKNLEELEYYSSEVVKQKVKEAGVTEGDILMWSDFNHPKKEGYGRKVIYKSDQFEIMAMSWNHLDATAIHNHGHTKWGAVQTFGHLEHVVFDYQNEQLVTAFKEKLSPNEIIEVNGELIHQMINLSAENVLSLHVYGSDKSVDGITDNSLLFEVGKNEIQQVNAGVFYDLPKSEINIFELEFVADRLTEIGHYASLLRHYLKTGTKGPQYRKAVNYFQDRSFESRLITELEMDSKGVLYMVELNRVKELLSSLNESTKTVDAILADIYDFERFS